MIAKRVPRNSATSSPSRLVRYLISAQGGLNPTSWTRTADYLLDTKGKTAQGERIGSYRVTNCTTDDPAVATVLIEATQASNKRSKTDKTYHLVFSFPPGEQPNVDVLHAIEDQLCAAIGYAEHQRLSVVHIDTDHLHVHVAINKVHPVGFQNIEPYYDKKKLMEACERLEIQYDLQRTDHGLSEKKGQRAKVRGKAADIESQSGIETLTGYLIREVTPALRQAKNWEELHHTAATYGLEIKPRGAGLVIGDPTLQIWTKASACGRDLSLKALTEKLGPFQSTHQKPPIAAQSYQPKQRQNHPSSQALFEQYQRERENGLKARRNGMVQIQLESDAFKVKLQRWRAQQQLLLKVTPKGIARRLMQGAIKHQAAASMAAQRQALADRRKTVFAQTSTPVWTDWLRQQAENGHTEALAVLRSQEEREKHWQGELLTAEGADQAKAVVLEALTPQARKNGTMAYGTLDGGLVIDRSTHIQAQKATTGAALVALELASQRFEGKALIVEGNADFRQEVAQLAGLHFLSVRFADSAMEQVRQGALEEKKRQSQPHSKKPKSSQSAIPAAKRQSMIGDNEVDL